MDDMNAILGEVDYEPGIDEFESKSLLPHFLADDYTELKPLSPPVSALKSLPYNADFCGLGNLASCELTIKNTLQDGDSIMIDGIEFTARDNHSKYCQEDEFSICGNPSGEILAKRLISKIFASKIKGIYRYLYDLNQDTITISSFSASALPLAIYTNSSQSFEIKQCDNGSVKPAIDLSTIRSLDCFIGSPEVEFSIYGDVINSAVGDNMAIKTAMPYVSRCFKEYAADGDVAFVVKMKLITNEANEVKFIGCIFISNPENCLGGQQLKMIEPNSQEYFTVNWSASASDSIYGNRDANRAIVNLDGLFHSCKFKQMVYIKLNDEREKIIDKEGEGGKVIASTEGAMASLSCYKTHAKKLQDFQIKQVWGDGITFSAKISGVSYMHNTLAHEIPDLCYGSRVEMNSASGNVFAINLGYGGLTCLADAKYFAQASNAYRALFGLASKY